MTAPDMLAAALAAYDAGLCVVQVRVDGSKQPVAQPGCGVVDTSTGEVKAGWKKFQTERPDRDTVAAWFANGHAGLGIVCGDISGGLEMLEVEGTAVADGFLDRLTDAVQAAGLAELFGRVIHGYTESTPKGGAHWLLRVSDGAPLGNTKLAMRPRTDAERAADPANADKPLTLVETRGERGYVVVAPSHGKVHDTGKPYRLERGGFDRLATVTAAERDALYDVVRSLSEIDTTPAAKRVVPDPVAPGDRVKVGRWTGGTVGESWLDAVVAHVNATTTVRQVLEQRGWTHVYDAGGMTYMRHPSASNKVSAVVNDAGRLLVYTSSTSFEHFGSSSGPTRTYDVLDVIAEYEAGGDRMAAARRIAEATGIYAAWEAERVIQLQADHDAFAAEQVGATTAAAAVGTVVDTSAAAAVPTNLPAEFWQARPALAHIRQAAHNRGRSADAVLGAVLCRLAVLVPPTVQLPAIVGGPATLDLLVGVLAASGVGKSSAVSVSKDVLPISDDGVVLDFPVGSGEGIVDAFLGTVEEVDVKGKKTKVRRQVNRAVLAEVDEGQVLTDLAHRKGSTLLSTLRSAWSGMVLGQGNATAETNRRLQPRSYRFAATIALQPRHAVALLADADGGTPQRILWCSAEDPSIPDDAPPWPGPLPVCAPGADYYGIVRLFGVDAGVAKQVSQRSRAASRGALAGADPLDSHGDLLRLKVAALLAVLDGRLDVNADDWRLAGDVMTTSRAVRTLVVETSHAEARRQEQAATARAVRREAALATTAEQRALRNAVRAIANRAHREPGQRLLRSKLGHAVASRDKALVPLDDAIAEAVRLGWLAADGGGWIAGEARPA